MTELRFPDGFTWGVATSAYQVEGAVHDDGRGESIWDRFSHAPGRTADGDTGDVACDHYHHWRDDIALMADLGANAYRFSIAWPRLFPQGRGALNERGLAFYDRLVDELLANGIAPLVTLYHWDLPQALDDAGGWLSRGTADRFADFATGCFERLGDRVRTWFTVNEPWVCSWLGYYLGLHAPGHRDFRESLVAAHHLLLAHGRAVEAFHAGGHDGRIGIVLNLMPADPLTDAAADREAARISDLATNRWYLDAVLRGSYPTEMVELYERLMGPLDFIEGGDADVIGGRSDLLGVNYYHRRLVAAPDSSSQSPLPFTVHGAAHGARTTDAGWEVSPDSLRDLLLRLHVQYPGTPLLITENGGIFDASPGPDGRVHDIGRTEFLRDHLVAAHQAISAGVPLEGYVHWSLMDNFEWADGYAKRFGLVWVDFRTQQRIPKDSARAFAEVIAANAVTTST